jgi:hypothetical protein
VHCRYHILQRPGGKAHMVKSIVKKSAAIMQRIGESNDAPLVEVQVAGIASGSASHHSGISSLLSSGHEVLKTGEALKEVAYSLSWHNPPSLPPSCALLHFFRATFLARQ